MHPLLLLAACGPSVEDVVADAIAGGFQGFVHVEHLDDRLILDAWGDAVDGEAPNTVDTVFDIGSLTKQFTAAAILEARDRDLLDVDDPLSAHFADVPSDRADLTLHELLTHTAGFPESVGPDDEVLDRDAWLALAWTADLGPAGDFAYSNVGYGVLAAILELRTGQPYETVLRDWFFDPLGMIATGYDGPDRTGLTVAHGYLDGVGNGPPLGSSWSTSGPYWNLTGNGGLLSTAADLRRWIAALDHGEVLTERSRRDLWDRHVRTWPRAWYGYGWGVEDWLLMGWNVNHDGSDGSFFAHLVWWPDQETYIALCSNHWRDENEDLAWRLSRAVLR